MKSAMVNILLVEDNVVDVEAVKRGLSKQKIANPIHVAADGAEALDLLRNTDKPFPRPFLVLLDLNMPRMNGIEFLRAIRADKDLKKTIVFVLTTSKSDEDMVASYEMNVAGYIVKDQVGESFVNLVSMLDSYWRVVEFPPESSSND